MANSKNAAIFDRIWKEETYLNLHRAKDKISPFLTTPNTEERREALSRFDALNAAINLYEKKAGIV